MDCDRYTPRGVSAGSQVVLYEIPPGSTDEGEEIASGQLFVDEETGKRWILDSSRRVEIPDDPTKYYLHPVC